MTRQALRRRAPPGAAASCSLRAARLAVAARAVAIGERERPNRRLGGRAGWLGRSEAGLGRRKAGVHRRHRVLRGREPGLKRRGGRVALRALRRRRPARLLRIACAPPWQHGARLRWPHRGREGRLLWEAARLGEARRRLRGVGTLGQRGRRRREGWLEGGGRLLRGGGREGGDRRGRPGGRWRRGRRWLRRWRRQAECGGAYTHRRGWAGGRGWGRQIDACEVAEQVTDQVGRRRCARLPRRWRELGDGRRRRPRRGGARRAW